ncbi:aromatic ring-hydroxylating dioxygenase subunit alpha [Pseudomonas sp. App30]|uniref:aromatic ring-hydroxylating dioxygenase subunit alpha n=1 Tax=Pseudomonas sp. App30 TaxID=3068990 RepID=UPI003A80B7CF
MKYLLNTWYVAAWADEISAADLLARTLLEQPILFFRDSQGSVQAIYDRCPHRFAPLHEGKRVGDSIQCAYHGLHFDGSGACAHNPHGDGKIPKAACVRSYPVVERDGLIWFWPGDVALADESSIADFAFYQQAPAAAKGKGYLPTKANYELLSDNIMDLSHVDYLHPDTLGGGALSSARAEVQELPDNKVRISWWAPNEAPPPAFGAHLKDPSIADVWADVVWHPPGYMLLRSGATEPGAAVEDGPHSVNLHLMTPQDAGNTHYFYANTRSFERDNQPLNDFIQQMLLGVFANEDKPMVEAQQRQMGNVDLLGLNPVLLPVDAGAIRCRRVLKRLIDSESAVLQAKSA